MFRTSDLDQIMLIGQEPWRLPKTLTRSTFTEFLLLEQLLEKLTLDATPYRSEVRYVRGQPSLHELALTLRPHSYLSHGTALFLHGLTGATSPIREIILNQEQSPKPASSGLGSQAAIDRAFAKEQRLTNYRFRHDLGEILLINGKSTGRYGVVSMKGPSGESLEVTGLERTLVDCAVRPAYAGGIHSVMTAYRQAVSRVSIPALIQTLDRLDYVYPYHQSIGFLLQRAGCSPALLKPLQKRGMDYDFYACHQISDPVYDKQWRIWYPRNL